MDNTRVDAAYVSVCSVTGSGGRRHSSWQLDTLICIMVWIMDIIDVLSDHSSS